MMETSQKTEKFLLGTLSVLLFVLAFNFYTNVPTATLVASAESQDSGSGDDEGDSGKSSDNDEDSGDSANSEDETSEPSAAQTSRTRTTVSGTSEKSTSQQEVSVASVNDETGKLSEESVKSLKSEDSSITAVSTEGNVSIVKREGKLFFLIPVEIESQVTTNETGTVISEKRNFLNWLKALLSS